MKQKGRLGKCSPFLILLIVCCLNSAFGQIGKTTLTSGQLVLFRRGYIVTNEDDTIYALICHASDSVIYLINPSIKIKGKRVSKPVELPFTTAGDGRVKSFLRNGLRYEPCKIGNGQTIFLTVLKKGPLTLYAQLYQYADNGFYYTLSKDTTNSFTRNFDDEYYDIKAYYLKKEPAGPITHVPKSTNRFRKIFYPLTLDNKKFIESIYGQNVNYNNISQLVEQYNSTYIKNQEN